MSNVVHVAFCMDTEGPCVDPANPDLLKDWGLVDVAMDKLFAPEFRGAVPDSFGGDFKIGWFFLTWTGFATNPRGRDFGYHKVRDHYLGRWGQQLLAFGDEQCWHYHQPAASGIGNEWGLDWRTSREYEQIISRQILERNWFPTCFRAGGTIMSAEASRWVDSWFPIDYTNRAPTNVPGLIDWGQGVTDWRPYHPDAEDFRRPGSGRRRMLRCLDLVTNVSVLAEEEIEKAFASASQGVATVLSVFDHDYRDIQDRLLDFRRRIERIARRYPDVKWQYSGPIEAVRKLLELPREPSPRLQLVGDQGHVRIRANRPVFQAIPWIALQGEDGSVHHVTEGILASGVGRWTWYPPSDIDWREAAVAVSSDCGEATIARIDREGNTSDGFLERTIDVHTVRPHSIWEYSKVFHKSCRDRASGVLSTTDSVRQAMGLLSPRLVAGMSVLDVGCAAGHAYRALAPLGIEYFGIDPYADGIEIGRHYLSQLGLPDDRLRVMEVENLPPDEEYDAVLCLNVLGYLPMFHLPLEIMARACKRWLVIRSAFGDTSEVRYLPDVLLEEGFHTKRAYFNIFSREDVATFLDQEGFRTEWIVDVRQREKFGGRAEEVGGVSLPAEFLFAERVRPVPDEQNILGERFLAAARRWHSNREGGPNA